MTDHQGLLADCPARLAFDLLAHTWDPVILWALRRGPVRPHQLVKHIGGISPKAMNQSLHRLRAAGLVQRLPRPGTPPHVDYTLTPLGRTLLTPLATLGTWAATHGNAVTTTQTSPTT
ncbi:winged helix-turn-helix transcriptional regulator [Kitasatospora sp. NPDC091335]|uniref:winged helix-turn-helix transcriptional regulator n=1 Tax=Kitasatospora sp. NPDC091335 TaxID=3364085 RepID=UPI0038138F97